MRGLTLALVLLALLIPAAGSEAGWSRGPDMVQPRTGAAAALLHDGSVLMVGGRLADGGFAGVERLDDPNGAWAPTGNLIASRTDTTAVTLPDGTVLAVGGWHWNPTDSERYDPVSAMWHPSGRSGEAWNTPVVALADGRVLALTGEGWDQPTGLTDIFDPATGTWSRAANDPEVTEGQYATLLADGRVLVAGGRSWLADSFWWYTPEARVYDPATNTWSRVAAMPEPRVGRLAERLLDGRVLVVDGANDEVGRLPSPLLYDPLADRWTAGAQLPADFRPHASVRLRDGTVMAIGDFDPATGVTASIRYDPATDAWSALEPLMEHRGWGFTATLLADGRVLVAGGFRPQEAGFSRTTEIWTPPCVPHPSRGRGKATGRHRHGRECTFPATPEAQAGSACPSCGTGTSTKDSTAMSGSVRLSLRNAWTVRPVICSTAATRSSLIVCW
jgi:hypothetical protein